MTWSKDVSFDGFQKKVDDWYAQKMKDFQDGKTVSPTELCNPPIDAQYALNLIFKTLVDDDLNLPYLTEMPESAEQVNYTMLFMILDRCSRKFRKYVKRRTLSKPKKLR